MKIYKALLLSSLFMTLIYSCSLPADDEEKETYLEEEDNATAYKMHIFALCQGKRLCKWVFCFVEHSLWLVKAYLFNINTNVLVYFI